MNTFKVKIIAQMTRFSLNVRFLFCFYFVQFIILNYMNQNFQTIFFKNILSKINIYITVYYIYIYNFFFACTLSIKINIFTNINIIKRHGLLYYYSITILT